MERYSISQEKETDQKPVVAREIVPNPKGVPLSRGQLVVVIAGAALVLIGSMVALALHQRAAHTQKVQKSKAASSNSDAKPSANSSSDTTKSSSSFTGVKALSVSAIETKKTDTLQGHFARRVRIVIVGGANVTVDADEALKLFASGLNGAQNPWNWHITSEQLASWQNGPYGQYFSDTSLVGSSNNGFVVSVTLDGSDQIDTVFIAPNTDQLTPPADSGGSNAGSTPPGPTTGND